MARLGARAILTMRPLRSTPRLATQYSEYSTQYLRQLALAP